jgi:hypothetical protein
VPVISFMFQTGEQMENVELTDTLKALKGQRDKLQNQLAKLDKAIAVLGDLSASNGRVKKRVLSSAARARIAQAQRLRWAKLRQAKAAKAGKSER